METGSGPVVDTNEEDDKIQKPQPRYGVRKKLKPIEEGKPANSEVIKGPVDLGSKIEMITEPKKKHRP